MERGKVPYKRIVFVCVNKRQPNETCCSHRQSEAIAEALKARVKALGLSRVVRVSKSGCQDLCAKGPNVMVFPDDIWYQGVTQGDVERIIQDTIRGVASPVAPACLSRPRQDGRQVRTPDPSTPQNEPRL